MRQLVFASVFLLVFGLFASALSAQSPDLARLAQEAKAASGARQVELLLALTDAQISAGLWSEAETHAELSEKNAKNLKLPLLRAEALHRKGLLHRQNKKERRAVAAFEESNRVLRSGGGNPELRLKNLQQLRQIAEERGNQKDVRELDAEIAALNNPTSTELLPPPETPRTRAEMKPEMTRLTEIIQKLENDKKSAGAPGGKKGAQPGSDLMTQLAAREAVIQQMNEQQAKNELLFAQQRRMLDSLAYQAGRDSMAIANWNLELRRAESSRNFNYALIGLLVLLFGGATFNLIRARQNARVLTEKNQIIREEQERSENLLLNILPALVADELKKQGHADARYFEEVSVLFADFVGFSTIAEKLSPQQLVSELDTCFKAFDDIIARHGLEKIKTIGDAYMCAGGLPNGGGAQLRDMVQAAKEMQAWLAQWNAGRDRQGLPRFDARIGIHAGPVVAGVVGSKKFAFDIWGDTVNIAARVESAGEGGKINISGEVHAAIKKDFECAYRGKIAVKNKGEIDMYFVLN
jgi:class 3 adenylate cyclase